MKSHAIKSSRVRTAALPVVAALALAGSASGQMEELGSLGTAGETYEVTVSGTIAYVASGDNGLRVIDISDPASPVEIGSLDTEGSARDIALRGSLLYLADQYWLRVIDVSNPASPVELGSFAYSQTQPSVQCVAVSGTVAYIGGSAGFRSIDVSDPANPVQLDTWDPGGQSIVGDIEISGDLAYVGIWLYQFVVFDISDPANIAPIAFLSIPEGENRHSGLAFSGTTVFATMGGHGLFVIDVSDPTSPVMVGSLDQDPNYSAQQPVVSGNRVYLAGHGSGLHAIDVSDPTSPVELARHDTAGLSWALAVSGTVAYVADDTALRAIDVSSPTTGGCCMDGNCVTKMSDANCTAIGGTFLGSGSTCAEAVCAAACPQDGDGDGEVGFSDLLDVLSNWGPCP